MLTPPDSDQIEVTTFGPGYGECIIVHLGNNNWIVVDSCIDSVSGQPAAVQYLRALGVDPKAVRRVIATHWHDDHIRGMAQQLAVFENAKFCTSAALSRDEFVATITARDSQHGIVSGSGVSEIRKVLEILKQRKTATRALAGRILYTLDAAASAHGATCEVLALSPSDKQYERFFESLAALMPQVLAPKRRTPDQRPNDLAIVIAIKVGDQTVLLGADLEESGDPELGWSAILLRDDFKLGRSSVFKVPHHGSETANCDEVWRDILISNPIAVITPWNRNRGLPTKEDLQRIKGQTNRAFISSTHTVPSRRNRPYSVDKQIRETVGQLRPVQEETGFVRLRNGGKANPRMWCVELSESARHLPIAA